MTYCVGLTGGIGSGKSTAAAMFQELGATVIDADTVSHQLTQAQGSAIPLIADAFGPEFLTPAGALNRVKMRQLVFSDPSARQRLEGILHPLIRTQMAQQLHAATTPYTLLVVPLLLETGNYRELTQRILVVDCPEYIQRARAMQRSSLNESEIDAIMARQLSRADRLGSADDVIHNDSGLEELRQQVVQLHRSYLDRSSGNTTAD